MSGSRFQSRVFQYSDDNGNPLAGGSIEFFETETSSPEAIYLDADLNDEAENPLPLGADGRQSSDVFLDDTVVYRVVYKDANGVVIAEDDPVAGSDVTAAIAAHNADVDAHVTATTTNRGVVSGLANDAEAIAKADTSLVLTPSNLAALDASKTFKGFVEQATDAETEAGTDDERYTSPANIQALQATLAEIIAGTDTTHFVGIAAWAAGITISASDLSIPLPKVILKGGKRTSTTDAPQTFTFGAAFPTNCYGVIIMRTGDGGASDESLIVSAAVPITASGFTIDRDDGAPGGSVDFFFVAWGN